MRDLSADVIWYLANVPLIGEAPELCAREIWTLDPVHGARGVRAVADGTSVTTTALRRLPSARVPGEVLGVVRTSTQRVSVTVNHNEHVRHLSELMVGMLGRASRCGDAPTVPLVSSAQPAISDERPLSPPEVVQLAGRVVRRLVRARAREASMAQRWSLAYHFSDEQTHDGAPDGGPPVTDPRLFRPLVPPNDRYWADPFPAVSEDKYFLFYEEHLSGARDAHLAVAELDAERGLTNARVVLRRPYHLSFPSVFAWNGEWYLTPETMTEHSVQLYRAERFPDDWRYIGDLVHGHSFVDPVVTLVDGRWWMFVGVMPVGGAEATVLHLYHADTPLGPWKPHVLNPIVVDVCVGRPAGRVFRRGDVIYRPVQDGAPYYGRAMNIQRIDQLTATAYHETNVGRVEPTWRPGVVGTHTLNAAGRLSVLDALQLVPRAGRRDAAGT